MDQIFDSEDYTIAWICALPLELTAAVAILDKKHPQLPQDKSDDNAYVFGQVGHCNIIITCLPSGVYGIASTTDVVVNMRRSFPSITAGLLVGVGGGAPVLPQNDIRLGDVVVSEPVPGFGGVLQYDFGKTMQEGQFVQTGVLNKPPIIFLKAIAKLKSGYLQGQHNNIIMDVLINGSVPKEFARPPADSDRLFQALYNHPFGNESCDQCDFRILIERPPRQNRSYVHYGLIASGNQVMKHSI